MTEIGSQPLSRRPSEEEVQVYVPRGGEVAQEYIEALSTAPERMLDDADREKFFTIDDGLLRGTYECIDGSTIGTAPNNGKNWYRPPRESTNFVTGYFDTEEGREALAGAERELGVARELSAGGHPTLDVHIRLAALVAGVGAGYNKGQMVDKLAAESHEYAAATVFRKLESGEPLDAAVDHLYLYKDADGLIDHLLQLRDVRDFMRTVRQDIKKRDDVSEDLRDALLVEVDGYRQRITEIMGQLYPGVINLYKQALLLDPLPRQKLLERLGSSRPMLSIASEIIGAEADDAASGQHSDVAWRFAATMDRWRNGYVADSDVPIGEKLEALEEELEFWRMESVVQNAVERSFTEEEIGRLDKITFNAEDIADAFRAFLNANDILSTATGDGYQQGEWPRDSTKQHPKIGVLVGEFKNLKYEKGWLFVPKRTLRKARQTTPSGVAYVVPHELEHGIDGITGEYMGRQVGLAQARSRMATTLTETVGKMAENDASQTMFGERLSPSLCYLKALKTWLGTGNEQAAIEAFVRQAMRENPGRELTIGLVKTAENRVQRLINHRGLNSQALAYIYQVLIGRALDTASPDIRAVVAANARIDLGMQVRLHQFGLLGQTRYQPEVSPIAATEQFFRSRLKAD